MLSAHLGVIEDVLLAKSKIAANTGHSLHKGIPREAFIKEFLETHLPETIAIGTGEIIDQNSSPNKQRRQNDIVLYKKSFPKLDIGGGVSAFLAESVIATIEVKSMLDKEKLKNAITAAHEVKQLKVIKGSGLITGYQPPSILSYVVSYDSPKINTVLKWVQEIDKELNLDDNSFETIQKLNSPLRSSVVADGIDGIFCLGEGVVTFNNTPFGFVKPEIFNQNRLTPWCSARLERGALAYLFLLLVAVCTAINQTSPNFSGYLESFSIKASEVNLG